MKKKILSLILAGVMVMSMAACAVKNRVQRILQRTVTRKIPREVMSWR